ncbi:branched-chain-amino-acid aminotransferase 2, chloroplastic isoform X3 [Nicotiana tabacum]|uniref:Branched-chain-amino-acid aminotransferase 2, chloroplastic isoform X3 n=1 Tax=Nicotiana tabacum TaxID=4097 RepID=A0A1S3YCT8_TOBAC|nr:PREDICTED: branched-chain-amino-acid aminotransferase 2, chloroplastic-like isoform X3 [Nicotiana tabacum]XP_033516002.1 branched-chain-amino-acid aminotransferase 2, chloroplastic-like isoform X3 [Nicotiana tomentosiformis]
MASNHIVSSSQSALNSHSSSPSPTSLQPSTYREYEPEEIDWDNLGFKVMPTDYMFIAKSCLDGNFEAGQLNPFGNIQLSPSAGILNYGQGLIEGTKAYRREDGRIYVFRPQDSAIRMQIGAERLCMPFPSVDQFVDAVKQTALANKRWQIPPAGKGSLYIRPLLMGSGAVLGVAPAPEYTFLVYSCPVGIYLKDGTGALSLYVEEEFHRSALGGAGGIKSITNYAPVMKAMRNAKGKGFTDVLYLDSVNNKYIEEASSSNIFLVKVEERMIEAEELITADEVFCTGTALGVAAVGSVTYKGKRIEYKISSETISQQLNSRLVGIQRGTIEDKRNWIVEVK